VKPFSVRGFNFCESLLRHTPEQLRTFLRRMKTLNMNTVIIHYDYGWKRYRDLILEECEKNGIEIILMTFGPRTFLTYSDWKPSWFARKTAGTPFTERLECETHLCCFEPECLAAYEYGAKEWLKHLPPQVRHVHMRAADGLMFCQCEKCRTMPEQDRWQPFVDLFTKAVLETRPDLRFETDVYVKRYNIPQNHQAFTQMTDIMYDTFYRSPQHALVSGTDRCTADMVQYAASEKNPDAPTAGLYHVNRLREWSRAFPGKIYIHENAMAQGLCGTFQYGTGAYLKDLDLFRELGIRGVCYEAYEPGFANFASMFEILAKAMNGEEVEFVPSEMEQAAGRNPVWFDTDPEFPLEKYIHDPFALRQHQLYRSIWTGGGLKEMREYLDFVFENEERLDLLFTGFFVLHLMGLHWKKVKFRNLTELENDFLHRRKLWDFMEDVPVSEDPRKLCRNLIQSMLAKSEEV